MRLVKILIRLRECADLSESSLDAHVKGTFSDISAEMYIVFVSES